MAEVTFNSTQSSSGSKSSPAAARRTLIAAVLWAAWFVLLASALIVGTIAGADCPSATAARMGSSVALVVAAFWFVVQAAAGSARQFALAMAVGMTLGAIGDFYNADLLDRFAPGGHGVLGGIAAFGLGHLAYIAGVVIAGRRCGLWNVVTLSAVLGAWLAVALAGWYAIVYLGAEGDRRALVVPALVYSLLLASTAGLTCGLAVQAYRGVQSRAACRGFATLATGAALFFLSDMVLAWGMFRESLPWQSGFVWLLYGPGQMLIVFAVPRIATEIARAVSVDSVGPRA